MDLQRLFLFLIFSLSVFLLWDGWERTQHPVTQTTSAAPTAPAVSMPPVAAVSSVTSLDANAVVTQQKQQSGQKITVKTDWLVAEISTVGGDLRQLKFLKQYDGLDLGSIEKFIG